MSYTRNREAMLNQAAGRTPDLTKYAAGLGTR